MQRSHTLDEASSLVLTSFAIGERYETEMEHLLHSVARVYVLETHQPTVIVGRLSGTSLRAMRHHLSTGREEEWRVMEIPPVVAKFLTIVDSFDAWWPIVGLKAWWLDELFRRFNAGPLVWLDADARVHRRLDLQVPECSSFLGAHWQDFEAREVLHSGTLILQGQDIYPTLAETAARCLASVWARRGHQEILQEVVLEHDCPLFALPDSYCATALPDAPPSPDAVVSHWQAHRHRIDASWPPPEAARVLPLIVENLPEAKKIL